MYVVFGDMSLLILITMFYTFLWTSFFPDPEINIYMIAILSGASGGIWGFGINNTMNKLREIRKLTQKELLSKEFKHHFKVSRIFAIICITIVFIAAFILGLYI
jgi:hypothetical protein